MTQQEQIFSKLQNDIMKILTRNSGIYLSQYKIYDELLDNLEIKDPIEKENLKVRFLIILRQLSYLYKNVSVINKNGLLSASFDFNMDETENNNKDDDNINNEYTNIDTDTDTNKKYDMPSEIYVINFIIDENLDEYLYRKDYKGNTVLHNLILNNDYNRIKKSFNKLHLMLYQKNNNDEYPTDLISDFKINNLITNYLISRISEMENNVIDLTNTIEIHNNEIYKNKKIIEEMKCILVFFISIGVIYIVFYIIFFIVYSN
jgi:hypothetical protein